MERQFARRIGVSYQWYYDFIEADKVNPRLETVQTIADALGVTIDFLLGGDDMIMDKKLLQKIKDIESFTDEEKAKIYDLIDMAISYHKTKNAYAS